MDKYMVVEAEKFQEMAFNQFMAYTYLDNADKAKYGTLLTGLNTQTSLKNNQYPKTVTEAANILSKHHWHNAGKTNNNKVDLFCNPNLVTNICTTTETLEVSTNGGKLFTNQKATVPNYGKVWYNPNAVTNIFSLSEMEKKHRFTYYSTKQKALTVHLPNKEVKFIKSSNGLYYHKPKYDTNKNKDRTPVNHTIIPISASVKSFSHVMIAGVDDNINFGQKYHIQE
jgi:hypothetical protein